MLVGTETEKRYDEIIEEVLKRLEENNLYIKLEKYMQKIRKIKFLGIVIGPNRIEIKKKKVDEILSWPELKNVKNVRKFLDLTNYYRRFIKDSAQVARLINILTRKDVKQQWGNKQQRAFDELKRIFTMRPVLAVLDLNKEFRVEVDTSNYTTGGVLSIKCSDNLQRPVAFILKSLSDTERNYEIYNKKILAMIRCLEAWRYFLERTTIKFKIWTDHKNLEYFMKAQKLNRRQVRQTLYLLRFNFMLKHVPESKIEKTDSLSRRPNWEIEVDKNNKNKILVKPKWLIVKRTEKIEIIVKEVNLLEKVRQSKMKDNEVIKAVKEIKWVEVKMLRDKEQREVNSVIYKEGKVYVPKNNVLRVEIIRLYYNILVEGHRGQQKTVELVIRNFWWPEITKEIKRYVEGCNSCQRNKNYIKQLAGKLISNLISNKPQIYISADFITKLPLAQDYDSIRVVVDQLTKIVYFILTMERMSAEKLARLFRNNM